MNEILEKVRSLDDDAKRNVLIASSSIAIAIVLGIWIVYFNAIVIPPSSVGAEPTSTAAPAPIAAPSVPFATGTVSGAQGSPSSSGFWHTIGNGFSAAWQGLTGVVTGGNHYVTPGS